MIHVEVAKVGHPVTKVTLNGEHTVGLALEAANVRLAANDSLSIDGSPVSRSSSVRDGEVILISPKLTGGKGSI